MVLYRQYKHSEKYLRKVATEVYQHMYEEAKPFFDFKDYFRDTFIDGKTMRPPKGLRNWYDYHYLPSNRQHAIFNLMCKIYPMSSDDKVRLRRIVYHKYPPNTSYENWKQLHADLKEK